MGRSAERGEGAAVKRLRGDVEQGYLVIDNNLSERTLQDRPGGNNWGVVGSEEGGRRQQCCTRWWGPCKHLLIDPFAYLREALPGLFALGEGPKAEQLQRWLPDAWALERGRAEASRAADTGVASDSTADLFVSLLAPVGQRAGTRLSAGHALM